MDEHTETAEAQEPPIDDTPVATQLANLLKRFKAETNEYERTCAKMAHPVSPAEQVAATKREWLRQLTALLPAIQDLQREADSLRDGVLQLAEEMQKPSERWFANRLLLIAGRRIEVLAADAPGKKDA